MPASATGAPRGASAPRSLHEITLLSQAERLKGRPKLCSDCGICGGELRQLMALSCVFVNNQHEALELKLHGRNRNDGDELRFGIHRAIHIARLRPATKRPSGAASSAALARCCSSGAWSTG